MLQYLLKINSINIIEGDFNYDLLKALANKHLDIFTCNVQTLSKPTQLFRSLIYQGSLDEKSFH